MKAKIVCVNAEVWEKWYDNNEKLKSTNLVQSKSDFINEVDDPNVVQTKSEVLDENIEETEAIEDVGEDDG